MRRSASVGLLLRPALCAALLLGWSPARLKAARPRPGNLNWEDLPPPKPSARPAGEPPAGRAAASPSPDGGGTPRIAPPARLSEGRSEVAAVAAAPRLLAPRPGGTGLSGERGAFLGGGSGCTSLGRRDPRPARRPGQAVRGLPAELGRRLLPGGEAAAAAFGAPAGLCARAARLPLGAAAGLPLSPGGGWRESHWPFLYSDAPTLSARFIPFGRRRKADSSVCCGGRGFCSAGVENAHPPPF